MEKPPGTSCSAALEQFLLLSKTAQGAAAVELIRQALETPGIYVFGELLEMPNIKDVSSYVTLVTSYLLAHRVVCVSSETKTMFQGKTALNRNHSYLVGFILFKCIIY